MSSLLIKICGINSKDAAIATRCGPAHLGGFVFFSRSPRAISLALAKSLKSYLHPKTLVVALMVDAPQSLYQRVSSVLRPDYFQLHGSETPAQMAHIHKTFGIPVIKALSITTPQQMEEARAYKHADMILFDTQQQGGSGYFERRPFLRRWRHPKILLAGGLRAENLSQALKWSRAGGVDVSSGVESCTGHKVSQKIVAFIKMAQTQATP